MKNWTLWLPRWLYSTEYVRIGMRTDIVGHLFFGQRIMIVRRPAWYAMRNPYQQ